MGLRVDRDTGNEEQQMSIGLGGKNKYTRLDSDLNNHDSNLHTYLEERRRSTKQFVMACAIFASLNTVLIGYDVGVMSGAILFVKEDLKINEVQEEILIGSLSVVSLVGNLAGGKTADAIGRKWTMGLSLLIFQTGIAIMTLSSTFHTLMIGRLLSGIGMGIGGVIASVYIAEISPTVARGTLTSFPEIFVNFGIMLGYVSNYAFSGLSAHKSWRVMLAVGILPSVIIIVALFIIPESPRWLVTQNRVEEARSVLLRTNESEKEAEERLADIQLASQNADQEKAVWHELICPSPLLCRMLVIGVGIQVFQQITGTDAIVYYSPEIFKVAGIGGNTKLIAATVAVGASKTAFILVAIFLIDRVGRKPLLYVSTIGMTICFFCLGVSLKLMVAGPVAIMLAVFFVCSTVAFFSVGIGPICWVLSSEIYPLRLRAQAVALGSVGGRVSSGLVSMSFLSLARAISMGGTFLVFSAISALSVVFVYTIVPETKGKSLEQIVQLFEDERKQYEEQVELGDIDHLVQKE